MSYGFTFQTIANIQPLQDQDEVFAEETEVALSASVGDNIGKEVELPWVQPQSLFNLLTNVLVIVL